MRCNRMEHRSLSYTYWLATECQRRHMKRAPRLLFLCSDNSVLSQMAEGLARVLYGSRAVAQSAGMMPSDIDPMVFEVMTETHIDVAGHTPKSLDVIDPADVDIVIMVAGDMMCPPEISDKRQIQWPIDDPRKVDVTGDVEARRTAFRQAREALRKALRDADEELTWVAPASYMNWRAFLDGQPFRGASEVPFYSDAARLRGALDNELGPYQLQHAFPEEEHDPVFVLVLNSHMSPHDSLRMDRTNTAGFTGSWLGDEIAALCSLENGVRLVAGSATRSLMPDGRWMISGDKDRPTFFLGRRSRRAILPRVEEHGVEHIVTCSVSEARSRSCNGSSASSPPIS